MEIDSQSVTGAATASSHHHDSSSNGNENGVAASTSSQKSILKKRKPEPPVSMPGSNSVSSAPSSDQKKPDVCNGIRPKPNKAAKLQNALTEQLQSSSCLECCVKRDAKHCMPSSLQPHNFINGSKGACIVVPNNPRRTPVEYVRRCLEGTPQSGGDWKHFLHVKVDGVWQPIGQFLYGDHFRVHADDCPCCGCTGKKSEQKVKYEKAPTKTDVNNVASLDKCRSYAKPVPVNGGAPKPHPTPSLLKPTVDPDKEVDRVMKLKVASEQAPSKSLQFYFKQSAAIQLAKCKPAGTPTTDFRKSKVGQAVKIVPRANLPTKPSFDSTDRDRSGSHKKLPTSEFRRKQEAYSRRMKQLEKHVKPENRKKKKKKKKMCGEPVTITLDDSEGDEEKEGDSRAASAQSHVQIINVHDDSMDGPLTKDAMRPRSASVELKQPPAKRPRTTENYAEPESDSDDADRQDAAGDAASVASSTTTQHSSVKAECETERDVKPPRLGYDPGQFVETRDCLSKGLPYIQAHAEYCGSESDRERADCRRRVDDVLHRIMNSTAAAAEQTTVLCEPAPGDVVQSDACHRLGDRLNCQWCQACFYKACDSDDDDEVTHDKGECTLTGIRILRDLGSQGLVATGVRTMRSLAGQPDHEQHKQAYQQSGLNFCTTGREAAYILQTIHGQFSELLNVERQLLQLKQQHTPGQQLVYVGGDKAIPHCDVCATSVFNLHLLCRHCGLMICAKCALQRQQYEREGKTEAPAVKGMNRHTKDGVRVVDDFNWRLCTTCRDSDCSLSQHGIASLNLAHLIPDEQPLHYLRELETRMQNVMKKHQIAERCVCGHHATGDGDRCFCATPSTSAATQQAESLCHDGVLLLDHSPDNDARDAFNMAAFQQHWMQSKPVVFKNANARVKSSLFVRERFKERIKDSDMLPTSIVECSRSMNQERLVQKRDKKSSRQRATAPTTPLCVLDKFWCGYTDYSARKVPGMHDGSSWNLKLKDFPPQDSFRNKFPCQYNSFINNLPVISYSHTLADNTPGVQLSPVHSFSSLGGSRQQLCSSEHNNGPDVRVDMTESDVLLLKLGGDEDDEPSAASSCANPTAGKSSPLLSPQRQTRVGGFNLVNHLPDTLYIRPDLGPKMYIAYGLLYEPQRASTNLHLDITDAVNVLIDVCRPIGHSPLMDKREIERELRSHAIIDPVTLARGCADPFSVGAEWTLWHPSCNATIRRFVRELYEDFRADVRDSMDLDPNLDVSDANVSDTFTTEADDQPRRRSPRLPPAIMKFVEQNKAVIEESDDPIHDQSIYLPPFIRKYMKERYPDVPGIEGFTYIQMLNDAVFIPAGAPHQVRNILSCTKIAMDFVSPEGVHQSAIVTQEARSLSSFHRNKEDKLQLCNIVAHTVLHAVCTLEQLPPGSL